MSDKTNDSDKKLLELVQAALRQDEELRQQFQIGDKFRFVRERLQALEQQVSEQVSVIQEILSKKTLQLLEDEVLIYIYLFNAHGLLVPTWNKMVKESVFYEYSVNRPIYGEKKDVEAFIRRKENIAQHAYIELAIKKSDILTGGLQIKDALGQPLIRVREGSLRFNKMFRFVHNGLEYQVSNQGELVRKS